MLLLMKCIFQIVPFQQQMFAILKTRHLFILLFEIRIYGTTVFCLNFNASYDKLINVLSTTGSRVTRKRNMCVFSKHVLMRTMYADTVHVCTGCGMKTLSHRIHAGSRQTEPKEWPWMAALLEGADTLFCGGVLITDVHVLTAAHCTNSYVNFSSYFDISLSTYSNMILPNRILHFISSILFQS